MGAPVQFVMARLQEILDTLANPDDPDAGCPLSLRPCRIALYPGDVVAYDTCQSDTCSDGDGQLWANMVSLVRRVGRDRDGGGGSCAEWVLTANIGIIRCGPLPDASVDEIVAAANQQAKDADEILNVLTCCDQLPERSQGLFIPGGWTAISEQGGCVGGQWTVTAVIATCCD
jgi:hypothetical protein